MLSEPVYQAVVEGSRKYGVFGTGFTYTGHPVPAAVALETQRIYDERDIGAHVRSVIPRFRKRILALGQRPLVGEARCAGLVGGVELVADKAARRNFEQTVRAGAWTVNRATELGLIARALVNDTIALCPPLIITEAQIDDMFDILERALDDAERQFLPH
jgi:4-aminobutyrate--pyruvate transaminase